MRRLFPLILLVFLLVACSLRGLASPTPTLWMQPVVSSSPFSTPTIPPSTATPSPSSIPSLPPVPMVSPTQDFQVCSPLEGLSLEQVQQAVSNPFHPPVAGSDDPHQGIDITDLQPGTRIALAGRQVRAVMPGQVALVITDRFPYGNAILIETPLSSLPDGWMAANPLPTLAPTRATSGALTCPQPGNPTWQVQTRSLYLLYAHMQSAPIFTAGDSVTCGQIIGQVGSSGNALNPHLHIEVRVGPSNWRPLSLAHYDNSASQEEMANYCLWRVSEAFQVVDPMIVLGGKP